MTKYEYEFFMNRNSRCSPLRNPQSYCNGCFVMHYINESIATNTMIVT